MADTAALAAKSAAKPDVDVAILGAGFSGLGMGVNLLKAGRTNFVILEKNDDVGGTWKENNYPGCACDIPSHLYSFSFEQNPEWTRLFPTQPEIHRYLRGVVEKYGLQGHLRLNREVSGLHFDDATSLWHVSTKDGQTFSARVVVSGMGGLHMPAYPQIKGLENFRGHAFHSSHWNHNADLAGKKVAVIGTGASAIQFVPQIQPKVGKLHLFQRTPPWIVPKPDRPIAYWERWVFRTFPFALHMFRRSLYALLEMRALGFVKVRPGALKMAENWSRGHVEAQISDPELRKKVTPTYRLGCKRVLISNDYYPSLENPNVDVIQSGIKEVREHSIVDSEGVEREIDVLIFGTGFQPMALDAGMVEGAHGRKLAEDWAHGPEAHLGINVAGYPNFFLLMGPNTGLGHNSMIYMIESQVHYVVECLKIMEERDAKRLEVREDVQKAYNVELQEKLGQTVWASGCKSWYLTDEGKNATLWPSFTFEYRAKTRKPDVSTLELAK